jgi:hypothetical protein
MPDNTTPAADQKLTADQTRIVAAEEARRKAAAEEVRQKAAAAAGVISPPIPGDVQQAPPKAAAEGAISHPSVAAIVPATPGGIAGPDQPMILIHAKGVADAPAPEPVHIAPLEPVAKPIPQVRPRREEVVVPVGQEQLARSQENEDAGLIHWAHNHDDRRRPPADAPQQRAVPGVGFTPSPKGSA